MSLVRIEVRAARPYDVLVGSGALGALPSVVAGASRVAVVTDANVQRLHARRIAALDAPMLALEPGEASKSLEALGRTLEFMTASGLDRGSTLVALGGGVVGDLGGLAASLFMRGISVVQCPTTLLAQVDASIGGKTAINLPAGKNLAGTFHQPQAVLADVEVLATLPPAELRAGLGEVLKTALVGDGDLLALLEETADEVLRAEAGVLAALVERCARVKAAIVAKDEHEAGERRRLNLGHTFAHAIEHAAGFGEVPHGEAVAVGLNLALAASARLGLLDDLELPDRVRQLCGRLGLAASLDELRERYRVRLPAEALVRGLRHDKKGPAEEPALVLPEGIGAQALDRRVEPGLLAALLA